jgi:AcrR family transcriptional regulator
LVAKQTVRQAAPRRERMRGPERRAQILAAAREVFLESGVTGARTRDIAQRAEITEAFMFRIFESKEHIYREAVEVPVAQAYERLARDVVALSRDETLQGVELFRRINELILELQIETTPLMVLAVFSEIDRGREFLRQLMPPMRTVQRVASRAAGWRAPAVSPDVALRTLFAGSLGIVLDHILQGKRLDPRETAARVTELYAEGMPHLR